MTLPALLLLLALPQEKPAPPDTALPEVKVKAKKAQRPERADGPVTGYRPTRSATATKTDTPLRDVPQSVQVLPESLVKDQAMQSMADVLRYVPGASMNPGEGGRDQPVLRGISTSSDFYVDGLRDDALYFRDPYNAERIEILKGPSGMAFGRGGGGGVVNRVTKRPTDQPQTKVDLTGGSYRDRRATLDTGGRLAGFGAFRINGVAEESDGFRDGFHLSRSGLNPVMEFGLGTEGSLLAGIEHFEDRRTTDRGIPALNGAPYPASRATFFGNAEQSPSRAIVDALSLKAESHLAPRTILRTSFRATRYDTSRQNVQAGSVVSPATLQLKLSAYRADNLRTNFFDQTELETRFQMGGAEHLLLAGFELGRQNSDNARLTGFFGNTESPSVPAGQPRAVVTQWMAKPSDTLNHVTANVLAPYVQDQITFSPQWKAMLGVRYDRFKVALDDQSAANVDLARTDSAFSPRAGLVFQPNAAVSYYASYSYAFLPSSETLSLSTANADLKPEKAANWEVGAKWDVSAAFTFTAAAFRLDRSDVKSKDPNDPTKLVLAGLQRTDGLELGLQGQLLSRWQVYAGYANLHARVLKATGGSATTAPVPAGTRVPLVPRDAFTWWNKVEVTERFSFGLGLIYQGSTYASTTNAVRLPAFTRADAAAYFQVSKAARLALNLENLFDRAYFATAGSDYNLQPGAPFSGKLTLSITF